jgi:RNA recognition motif-containing protein
VPISLFSCLQAIAMVNPIIYQLVDKIVFRLLLCCRLRNYAFVDFRDEAAANHAHSLLNRFVASTTCSSRLLTIYLVLTVCTLQHIFSYQCCERISLPTHLSLYIISCTVLFAKGWLCRLRFLGKVLIVGRANQPNAKNAQVKHQDKSARGVSQAPNTSSFNQKILH